ncbi:MAG: hypothetical protein WCJ93_11190 [Methanomicrobiales archaeon]
MKSNHWLAALAIIGLLTAGCMGTPGKNNTPELTKTSDQYEALSMFDGYLERSPQDWYINGSFCAQGSCRQQLISANGDTILVTLNQYPSISDAQNEFNTVKKGLGQYSVSNQNIADSGYVWYKGNQGESGFLSGRNIGIVDYLYGKGDANGNESVNLAVVLAQMVAT